MQKLETFLDSLKQAPLSTYSEGVFTQSNRRLIDEGIASLGDVTGKKVLDVGVGFGHAAEIFKSKGAEVIGISTDHEEINRDVCNGYDTRFMDMSFLEFPNSTFDIVWARHCVEHSPFPMFTLKGFHEVLKPKGILYMEVPAPDMSGHERNTSHYSVLGIKMWRQLLKRVGFEILSMEHIDFNNKHKVLIDRFYRFISVKNFTPYTERG